MSKTAAGAQGVGPSASPRRDAVQPCQWVDVVIAERNSVRWHALLEALRERADERRASRAARGYERDLPFRDVILKGPHDPDRLRERDLRTLLRAEFADTQADFQTQSIHSGNHEDRLQAFFGNGVFAPQDEDKRVADLQFCWSPPERSDNYIEPRLDEQWPAAWYAGQMGVAVGLIPDPTIAPAHLDGMDPDLMGQVARKRPYIYIGRRDRLSTPAIEIYCATPTTHASAVCGNAEWWLLDGRWQCADIAIGSARFPLWFRLTSRTGDAVFRTGEDDRLGPGQARIVVRGLLLPELPAFRGLQRFFMSGEATWWSVEFDGRGRLRAQEISELAHSVVARWGTRFGVYRHRTASWLPRGRAFDALQGFELSQGADIRHGYFPASAGQVGGEEGWGDVYGRKWSLLQFTDGRPFGYFDVLPRATELVGATEDGTPARTITDISRAEWHVGLDWLNRAAHVQVGDQTIGLGDYWSRLWRTEINAQQDFIDVLVTSLAEPGVHAQYRIHRGQTGPLGPLYIEYNP